MNGIYRREVLSKGTPAAQKLWHVSKSHLLELLKEGFWRHTVVQPDTLAALGLGHGLTVRIEAMPIFEGKAAMGPELPWRVEPEEQPMMMVPAAEVAMLEMRHMTEPEHNVAIAELQHQPRVPELPEVPRLEVRGMSEPECETSVSEVPEVSRLERPRLSNEATVRELEARGSQVQLRYGVPRELPKTEAEVSCFGWLRHHGQRRHDSCEHDHFAHRGAP